MAPVLTTKAGDISRWKHCEDQELTGAGEETSMVGAGHTDSRNYNRTLPHYMCAKVVCRWILCFEVEHTLYSKCRQQNTRLGKAARKSALPNV